MSHWPDELVDIHIDVLYELNVAVVGVLLRAGGELLQSGGYPVEYSIEEVQAQGEQDLAGQ